MKTRIERAIENIANTANHQSRGILFQELLGMAKFGLPEGDRGPEQQAVSR